MPHIIILREAIEALETDAAVPPTQAQQNLLDALNAADEWAHEHETQTETIAQIEDVASSVKGYLDVVSTPSDIRLQGWADELNGLID